MPKRGLGGANGKLIAKSVREQSFWSRPGFESWPGGLGKALGREGLGRPMYFFFRAQGHG